MNLLKTTAPIAIEDLKKYFEDKTVVFDIVYKDSQLKGEKLLVYISNLDIPCTITFEDDDELFSLVDEYLKFNMIVNLPILENVTTELLLQLKGINPVINQKHIDDRKEQLLKWAEKLESMPLFNFYSIDLDEFKEFVKAHPEDNTDSLEGVNFVKLFANDRFFEFYSGDPMFAPKYYSTYFNEYMFKGTNLYSYWANENNPMFLLTWGVASGNLRKVNTEELETHDS